MWRQDERIAIFGLEAVPSHHKLSAECSCTAMKGLLSFILTSIGGGIGWWLGSYVGIMTALFLSILGTGAGLYYALRIHREYFE